MHNLLQKSTKIIDKNTLHSTKRASSKILWLRQITAKTHTETQKPCIKLNSLHFSHFSVDLSECGKSLSSCDIHIFHTFHCYWLFVLSICIFLICTHNTTTLGLLTNGKMFALQSYIRSNRGSANRESAQLSNNGCTSWWANFILNFFMALPFVPFLWKYSCIQNHCIHNTHI